MDTQIAVSPNVQDDDEIIDFVQSQRVKFIGDLAGADGKIGNDAETQKVYLKALSDMTTTALGRKRIQVEEQVGMSQAEASKLIAEVIRGTKDLRAYEVIDGVATIVPPELDGELPDVVLVPGELDVNPPALEFDTFMNQSATAAG